MVKSVLSDDTAKGNIVHVTQIVNERKEDQHFIYKKLHRFNCFFFLFFAHTTSENVNENLKERGKQILIHSPATPCK